MCYGSPAIGVAFSEVPPAPPQSPLQFTQPVPPSEAAAADSPAMSLFVLVMDSKLLLWFMSLGD